MKKFIDEIYLDVLSGSGGNGIISFERYKYKPIGKPNGGDGGSGGHIIIKVSSNLSELSNLKKAHLIKAKKGGDGGSSNKRGKLGENVYIYVPPGVIIRDYNNKEKITELLENNQEYIICNGGRGGRGNARFKSSINRSPRNCEEGKKGIKKKIIIELKLLADIGLVGFPNAGKSTLLKAMTDANPEIDKYPFTTLTPNLGVFYDKDYKPYTIADVPGIIEDAHKGKGLGLQFLKHIERTRILALIIDVTEKDYVKKETELLNELNKYDQQMLYKKMIFIGNKIDLFPKSDLMKKIDKKYILISALNSVNLDQLKQEFMSILNM